MRGLVRGFVVGPAALALLVGGFVGLGSAAAADPTTVPTPASAVAPTSNPTSAPGDAVLAAGESLGGGDYLVSAGGAVVLVVRASGAVVLYGPDGSLTWTVGGGAPGARLMLVDGVLRLVAPDGTTRWQPSSDAVVPDDDDAADEALDAPGTDASTEALPPADRLVLQDDGDLVLQDATGAALWSSGTAARATTLEPGTVLAPGVPLVSPDGRHVLAVRRLGNVVLLGPDSRSRWSTGTDEPHAVLALGTDGTLVVRASDGDVLWRAPADAVPGSRLVLQDDGDLVLYGPDRAVVWRTGTGLGPDRLAEAEPLAVGAHLDSSDGHLSLRFDADELTLSYDGTTVWSAPIAPGPDAALVVSHGALAVVGPDGAGRWATTPPDEAAADASGSVLRLDPTGAVLTAANGRELWRADVPADLLVAPAPVASCDDVDAPVPFDRTVLTSQGVRVHPCLAAPVEAMLDAARAAGLDLGASGWRSHEQQVALRERNCDAEGRCSPPTAVPGTSRHERGLALDVTDHGHAVRSGSTAYAWLAAHAGAYGLHNLPTEPWHWSVDGS
ncbi:hypothetical protein CCO02nite_28700 [Cellulomonas composti]|uniref:Bulb-type lectin domain-containing protein n=1 Tax=Cellulomonas composti TaxID=266130 RepID=A0A511JE19_9CELL|nr:hypothetical protein CCO02nite_28700 [Cellulomonas composti]